MNLSDFDYHLPAELIAQQPLTNRTDSRLLTVKQNGTLVDHSFCTILELIQPEDLLVFNDTQVIPARLFGQKPTGGKVEVLIERLVDERHVLAHVRASKSPKAGSTLTLEGHIEILVTGREGNLFQLKFLNDEPIIELLERYGHIPLPPYIERSDDDDDKQRYQTVYAKNPGAVAAPTAGLHFDKSLLAALKKKGVASTTVTLHVGAGTFQPVKCEDLSEHKMHAEWINVSTECCDAIAQCKQRNGRVIAVGTTSLRSLEAASGETGTIQPYRGDTRLFITPSHPIYTVNTLITNFHLPKSTLLMLVSAFTTPETIKAAYAHAIEQHYRFFSYGDAMWLEGN
ncbi:MAG: tRNA preQ1(34) S-adenosylmethionine ribosyltransferase-isomerase QueA [Thiotrichaceae bacterium]|nr:tRNA preQ1(34) S-adenosylmethionine ribosyltransferase-isomerase QueA [Thiotrichaceae bacterium]